MLAYGAPSGNDAPAGGAAAFAPAPARSGRRTRAGAFYTPPALVRWLLDRTLEPAIARARSRGRGEPDAVLSLRVCDPACGSGRFLVASAGRLAEALAADRARGATPTRAQRDAAMADVVSRCLRGVDIDDVAVDLCRDALAALAGHDAAAVRALDQHIRVGDALLGAPACASGDGADARSRADAWCRDHRGRGVQTLVPGPVHWGVDFADVVRPGPATGVRRAAGFDVIVGNPPFLNQLRSATAAGAGARSLLRARFGGAVRGYADAAAAFVMLALELVASDGVIGLVLPRSMLAVEHAGDVRRALVRAGAPTALWVSSPAHSAPGDRAARTQPAGRDAASFAGATVSTCAVVVAMGLRSGPLRRAAGPAFAALNDLRVDADELAAHPSWSHLVADAAGAPRVMLRSRRTLADLAEATADFRDQYYGLDGFIVDSAEDHPRRPRLITSGLIAPLASLWGRAPTRILKRAWLHPRLDLDALDARAEAGDATAVMMRAWARARLVPKVLIATQTRVLEVLPDPEGVLLACVPVITVTPKDPARLWHVAAALAAPAATLVAFTRHAGAGMSVDAIKLSAKQVLALPAPEDGPRFDAAAEAVRRVCERGGGLAAESVPECLDLDEAARAAAGAWWARRAGRAIG